MRNNHKPMVNTIPMTQARANLGQIAKRVVRDKEYFILEKDGIPVIGLMSADELEDYLELQDPKVRRHIAKSTEEFRAGKGRTIDELIAEFQPRRKAKTISKRRKA